jgi:hypothetical protein
VALVAEQEPMAATQIIVLLVLVHLVKVIMVVALLDHLEDIVMVVEAEEQALVEHKTQEMVEQVYRIQ